MKRKKGVMTEEEALEKIRRLRQFPATIEEGIELQELKKYMTDSRFSSLWSGFIFRLPNKEQAKLNRLSFDDED